MFRPANMKKLSIITLDKYTDSAVRSLHEASIVQIQDISERIQEDAEWKQIFKPGRATPYLGKVSSLLMKTTSITDFLKSVRARESGIMPLVKSFINPPAIEKKEMEDLNVEELLNKVGDLIEKVESKTNPLTQKLNNLDNEKTKLKNAHKVAENLINIDIDLADLQELKHVSFILGKINDESLIKFKENLKTLRSDEIVVFDYDADDKDFKILILISLKKLEDEISNILRKVDFEKFEISGLSVKPCDIIKEAETRIDSINQEKESIEKDLAVISAEWFPEFKAYKEQLEIEKQRCEISTSFGETNDTVMLEGWVTEKKLQNALDIIEDSTEGNSVVEVSEPDIEKDDIPIHLDNPSFAKPYELFVKMYSPPSYREFDPTILMAIVFPFFFGFCLTDAGYGLVDLIIGVIIFLGLGKNNKLMKGFGLILVACGAWTLILGDVTNGFIGNLFGTGALGNVIPLNNPFTIPSINAFVFPQNILIIALLVGAIHITIGLSVGTYNNITRGATRDALGSQVPWLILLAGVAIYLFTGSIYGLVPFLIATLALLMYFNGFFGFMDITGFLGTLLSYSRLLALCLSTGGMAITVNILTHLSIVMLPIIGLILAPIIFILGHIAVGAFMSLGAFINSLRLHYVEYFGQFFIGGGHKFKAFRARRKYTILGGK
ncbi:MAG: V-type ATP synthase subunit I [Methanobacterium sp.]